MTSVFHLTKYLCCMSFLYLEGFYSGDHFSILVRKQSQVFDVLHDQSQLLLLWTSEVYATVMGGRKLLLLNDHHHVFNTGCWVHEQQKIIEIISWYILADFIIISFWCSLMEMFCKEQLEIWVQINTLKSDNDQWTIRSWYLSYDTLSKLHFKLFIKACFY